MPLVRAPMLFVTVAQEKRDFKIFVILITDRSRVRVPEAPPNKKPHCAAENGLTVRFFDAVSNNICNALIPIFGTEVSQ